MDIGLIAQLHGRPDADTPAPTWTSVRDLATTAESVGFDMFVFEDSLLLRGKDHADGVWESVAIAGAIAASTRTIKFGQSVVNSPYRSPAMIASIATTLDEVSGGRYVLGIGAGNTPDSDYRAFGFPTDKRYSRFSEAIEIVHGLLREGRVDHTGAYYSVEGAELVLRGPHLHGPPINIAAGGPKMLGLVAQYADAWNWWTWDETLPQVRKRLAPIIANLDDACAVQGRETASLARTLDLYAVTPPGFSLERSDFDQPVAGTAEGIAEFILELGELGFAEVRCDLTNKTPEAVEAMAPVVDLVHGG